MDAQIVNGSLLTNATTVLPSKGIVVHCAIDKDAGFCSGGEDDESEETNTTNSDDSGVKTSVADVKLPKNKRKSEPFKIALKAEDAPCGPPKKRIRFDREEIDSPFRPWSQAVEQVEPLELVTTTAALRQRREKKRAPPTETVVTPVINSSAEPRVPPHPAVRTLTVDEINGDRSRSFSVESLLSASISEPKPSTAPKEQRNYKNMTRERRIEANARERTRVHTISAAFDTLRHAVPSYSHNQKLSKLSVLRIACSYILTLSRLNGDDYSAEQNEPSLEECVEAVTRTIQTEGKLRKKKDDV